MFKENEIEFMEQYFNKIMKRNDFLKLIDSIKNSKCEVRKNRIYIKKTKEQKKIELDDIFSSYDTPEQKNMEDDENFGVVLEKDIVDEELFGYTSE